MAAHTGVIWRGNFTVVRNTVIAVFALILRAQHVMTAGSGTFLIVFLPGDLMMACSAFELAVLGMVKYTGFLVRTW